MGIIIRDEEHTRGSRITLERQTQYAPCSITCGIYGSTFHTVFAGDQWEADRKYDLMKADIEDLLTVMDSDEAQYLKLLASFVERY